MLPPTRYKETVASKAEENSADQLLLQIQTDEELARKLQADEDAQVYVKIIDFGCHFNYFIVQQISKLL